MMKKRIYIAVLALAVVLPAAAQDTYESGRLLMNDLNGTARYVGMGGAMDAVCRQDWSPSRTRRSSAERTVRR